MQIIDTHSHLFSEEFNDDIKEVVARAQAAGVYRIFMPTIDSTTYEPLMNTCASYPNFFYPMIGLHPTSITKENIDKELNFVKSKLEVKHPFIAIGEIGIDLYWDRTYLQEQLRAFEIQIQWSLEYNLPIVIHCREAFDEIYQILHKYKKENIRGVFHSFTGTKEEAALILDFPGFVLGVNGILTFKKSTLPETLLSTVPLSRIVMETDSPYLAPVPYRGKRNESSFIVGVLKKLSETYHLTEDEVALQTTKTALNVFGFDI